MKPRDVIKRNGEIAIAVSQWADAEHYLIIPCFEGKESEYTMECTIDMGACGYAFARVIPANTEVEIVGEVREEERRSLGMAYFAALEGVEHEECVKERLGKKYPQSREEALEIYRLYNNIINTFTKGVEWD